MSLLHVANGHCTTSLIERAGIPGDTSIWADVLHDGPVPDGLPEPQLRAVRAGYLAGTNHGPEFDQVLASLEADERALESRPARDEIVLWFEHDLFDQLNLVRVLDRLATVPGTAPISLVCVDRFPGRPSFKGLGELTPGELASLLDKREAVTDRQFELARRAWSAFRSPSPQRIEELLTGDVSALPYLGNALRRHLEEFPSTANGLSRTEQRLMELSTSPIDARELFGRLHDSESCFYIGDLSFLRLVRELASLAPAVLTFDGDDPAADGIPRATIAVAPAGGAVLMGQADRVRDWGIDRWLGGVHLEWREPVWRWDQMLGRTVIA